MRCFVVLLSFTKVVCVRLGDDRLLPNPFELIIDKDDCLLGCSAV
jgi:hypothetical protein